VAPRLPLLLPLLLLLLLLRLLGCYAWCHPALVRPLH
jgi:hypothetical protein